MPNLLANLTPTSAYAATSGFGAVTGYSATVTIASTASVVLLIALVPWASSGTDAAVTTQFAVGGVNIGPVFGQGFNDNTDENTEGVMCYALTGVSGSLTYTVEADETDADMDVDTARNGMFVIIEFLDGEALLHTTAALTSASTAPAAYANMADMAVTFAPASAASINLCLAGWLMTGASDDSARLKFGVAGTVLTYGETQAGSDTSTMIASPGKMLAVSGQTGSTAFSLMWEDEQNAPTADTGVDRFFQVVEILGSDLLHDANGTGGSSTVSPWATQPGVTTTETITATGSIVLMIATAGYDINTGGSDNTVEYSFSDGGTREGPVARLSYRDLDSPKEHNTNTGAWAKTGISGSHTFAVQWQELGGTGADVDPRFQIIEIKVGAQVGSPTGSIITASLDAALQDIFTITASLNAALQGSFTKAASLNSALQGTTALSVSMNASLVNAEGVKQVGYRFRDPSGGLGAP